MNFVKIDPPGTLCTQEALRDALRDRGDRTFLDIGCGGGHISKFLCDRGLTGIGIDFSERAIEVARKNLAPYIAKGDYRLYLGDIHSLPDNFAKVDLAVSYMVMEHVKDDVGFIRKIARYVKPNGHVILGVPGRRDRWSLEDEIVGHFRRYDRSDLEETLREAGLSNVSVWSVAVPTANILFRIGTWLVARSSAAKKIGDSQREQTETSGIQEIPWKTVFPSWVRIILNRKTLWPLFVIQRMFYQTGLGITMMGMGQVQK